MKRAAGRGPARRAALQFACVDRGRPRTDRAFLRRVVRTALEFAGRPDLPVSLLLTDDAEIADLHARHLGDAAPTDVISFGIDGGAELVVSVETARRCAREHGHTLRAELALYVVHGILHTVGYDDLRARDRVRMRAAEHEVLRRLRLRVRPVDA
ncbi:MAG: rRNA maturation RNase YbeY [Planctomycetes bacterium]|nr:rRNA maturation RNase YbeY [Planctomycetota bacterium]